MHFAKLCIYKLYEVFISVFLLVLLLLYSYKIFCLFLLYFFNFYVWIFKNLILFVLWLWSFLIFYKWLQITGKINDCICTKGFDINYSDFLLIMILISAHSIDF